MFGDKKEKQKRLIELVQLIEKAGGITQTELARQLQVTRATIYKDLALLEERDVRLYEDERGRLYCAD